MTRITSLTNPFISMVTKLHTRKGREAAGMFVAEGTRVCDSLLQSPLQLEKLVVTDDLVVDARALTSAESIVTVPEQVMRKISTATTPSGMVGVFHIPPLPSLERISSGIVLARVMDPGNAGTLIRTAVAFGYRTVVCVEGVDPWNPKVVQASAGTLGEVDLFSVSWSVLYAAARHNNVTLSALVVRGGTDIHEHTYPSPHLFVLGGEAEGIPHEWVAGCDRRITLPMPGKAESLNVAVAGSLALAVGYWQKGSSS